jgi:hypothetical protein
MNANQIIKPLTKFRGLIAGVIIIAVLSYTAYLASSIFNVGPDAAYLQEQQKSAQTTSLKVPPTSQSNLAKAILFRCSYSVGVTLESSSG